MAPTLLQEPSHAGRATSNNDNDPDFNPALPWHAGEQEMHRLMRLPPRSQNPTSQGLPARYGFRITASPLVALGTLDDDGRPWVTLAGDEAGFARPVAEGVLAMKAVMDVTGADPVVKELLTAWSDEDGEQKGENGGKIMAGLSIDPETRDRVKFAGRMIVGSMTGYRHPEGKNDGDHENAPALAGEVQIGFNILETVGNCPKYINKKHITPHIPSPKVAYEASQQGEGAGVALPQEAIELVDKADMFFIASKHGVESMDVNHRGGAPGFMRVLKTTSQAGGKPATTLIYPEFSGNNLYQTLGNLRRDPQVGICVPDYDTGDVLYVTGTAEVLIGDRAAAYLPRTKLAVKVDIDAARLVKSGLGFRGSPIDHSPYNPTVKYLKTEKPDVAATAEATTGGIAVATLKTREQITDTVARYTFALSLTETQRKTRARLEPWEPGQYITLDFSEELDHGYRHMADDDPQSLNDDYVRSFTISAPIKKPATTESSLEPEEFEITIRRHGPVTALLSRWNLAVPLQVPVLGFGGDKEFRMLVSEDDGASQSLAVKDRIFLAQGVGITPLMAQAPGVIESMAQSRLEGKLKLLWSLRADDMLLARDVLGRTPGLAELTTLFVTGKVRGGQYGAAAEAAQKEVEDMGAKIISRRIGKDDILTVGEKGRRKYYACMSGVMRKALLEWMAEEDLVVESFDY
ncbi:uncharacterized protein B0I36DRAFT_233115 [Microdochium trichocladiopsis]|uniref:FAD-binding FR-type domain-containing protein n=1 Tax=Microdochium trichocladiopsis TaxID=1682393 RepID=A0A9P8YKR9_9PEZI|nr:uncharacterized protein B0I36DRAFT_233115 [Microdochium trichocladiopsis]KAH7040810.1 hypothetical protein B0I36DRAFT_233115 [Microdochium trichocladiopsis]